ncbi:MAG: transporter ATP-binding protein [Cryobacterium sp.]|jgi:iron(III) transport system ATP-binding protein|nr:transporter ATP-binding protein [Cryobacterium sp.]
MALILEAVSKSLGGTPVLGDISLRVGAGTRTAIVGSSGSGKSTLLRLIAGFDHPDSGQISLDGQTLAAHSERMPAHRRGIGYVAQDGALFPHLTVRQNIAFGLHDRSAKLDRIRHVCDLVGLDEAMLGRFPDELSGGQQQRVALARALAPSPKVILLDEPFSALDTNLRAQTRRAVVQALDGANVTTILVTHDQDEALTFGHQVGVLERGRLVQAGSPEEVYDHPVDAETAEFLGTAIFVPVTVNGEYADSVLGRLRVRHDESGGRALVKAMIRPDQLHVSAGPDGTPVEVGSVSSSGAQTEVLLRVAGRPAPVELSVLIPRHRAHEFRPGMTATIEVQDGVVLYPR